jgi:hypothetical protein
MERLVTLSALKKAALRAADYECLVAGDGFEPPTFGL